MIRYVMLLAIALLSLPAVSGAVTLDPISQDRRVDVAVQVETKACPPPELPPLTSCPDPIYITYEDFADADSAIDFGPFDATALAPGSHVTQVSSISRVSLVATGTWSSYADASFNYIIVPPANLQFMHVTEDHLTASHYEVTFELTRTVAFSLTGSLFVNSTNFGGNDNAAIALIGPGSTPVAGIDIWILRDCDFLVNWTCTKEVTLSEVGQLAPGTYTLRASGRALAASGMAGSSAISDSDSGSFTVALLIEPPPVPALPPGGALLLGGALVAALGAVRRSRARPGSRHA